MYSSAQLVGSTKPWFSTGNADTRKKCLKIAAAHRHTIIGSFAGHTHQDEFRIAAGNFIHVTPSLTPVFGNNPAFEIVDVGPKGNVAGCRENLG